MSSPFSYGANFINVVTIFFHVEVILSVKGEMMDGKIDVYMVPVKEMQNRKNKKGRVQA